MNEETLSNLFIHRNDVFAIQTDDGKYQKHEQPLTNEHLKLHLRGQITLGTYQLDREDTVAYACIDIDINKNIWSQPDFKLEDWKPMIDKQISLVKNRMANYGIIGYTEMSGFKGAHVWYFFKEPVNAGTAKDMNNIIFGDMGVVDKDMHIEYFPKQDSLGGGMGSLIKLPSGKHKRSGEFSYFLDDVMAGIKRVTQDEINKVINPVDSMFINCHVLDTIRKDAASGHINHNQRLALGYLLLNVDGGEEELRRLLKMQNDYDEKITDYQIGQIKAKKYKPVTCEKLQSTEMDHMCPGACGNIKSGKSPIVFYYRHTGKINSHTHAGQGDLLSNPTSKIDMYEKDGTSYIYITPKGERELISNFIVNITHQITRDDGMEINIELQGQVVMGADSHEFTIKAKDMAQPEKLRSAIYNTIGNAGLYCENFVKLQTAINKYTSPEKILIKEKFGYDGDDANPYQRYLSPSVIVDGAGVRENNEIIVDLSSHDRAQYLDLHYMPDDNEFAELKKHVNDDFLGLTEFGVTHSVLAHTMSPVIEPWLYTLDKTRYILFVRGSSGEGKSFLLESAQHFYGKNFLSYMRWESTTHAIGIAGFYFKDALYLVDDWKKDTLGKEEKAKLGILQMYADRGSRSRLDSNANLKESKPIRGTLVVAGEDFAEGQSSVLARTITLNYEQKVKKLKEGNRILKKRNLYSAITAKYIHHILSSAEIRDGMGDFQTDMHDEFYKRTQGYHNDVRIARNLSLLYTSYYYFSEWFWEPAVAKENQKKLKEYLHKQVDALIRLSAIQRPADKFWHTMKSLIAIGNFRLQANNQIDSDDRNRGKVIGYHGTVEDYLLMDGALREVEKYLRSSGESLNFSKITIIEDLYKAGYIKSDKPESKKFNNQTVHVYAVDPLKLRS